MCQEPFQEHGTGPPQEPASKFTSRVVFTVPERSLLGAVTPLSWRKWSSVEDVLLSTSVCLYQCIFMFCMATLYLDFTMTILQMAFLNCFNLRPLIPTAQQQAETKLKTCSLSRV